MLKVQEFLLGGGTLEDLETKFAIKSKRHSKHNNLVLLKYNQIESPFSEKIVRECRGLILDEDDNWAIVAMAFVKFFNYGESHADPIDWNSKFLRVQEKVDGSLCLVFFYKREWHVATTGTPDASGDVNTSGKSFADYFWDTLNDCGGFKTTMTTERNFCFIFELTGPLNRVVVPHMKPGLTLLGAREVSTWKELHPSKVSLFFPGVPVVREFPLQSIEDILKTFDTMSPLRQEGYVIVWENADGTLGRVKVKHAGYVALHHMKGTLGSDRALVEIVRTGEISEVVATFPEYAPILNDTKNKLDTLVHELESTYKIIKDIPEQKAFAMEALKSKCSSALFSVRSKKCTSIRDYFKSINIDSLMTLLNKV